MSGIEVAGVVIGAIPLLISALEHYKKARRFWHFLSNKNMYVNRLLESLDEQKALIQTEIWLLLNASGFNDADAIGLSDYNACVSFLTREDVVEEVSRYLGRLNLPYTTALSRCQSSLADIAKHIEGLVIGKTKLDPLNLEELARINSAKHGVFKWSRKTKFAIGKAELEQHLQNLEKSTATLRSLREAGASIHEIEANSKSRITKGLADSLQKAQRHAGHLYNTIAGRWDPGCHPKHGLGLFLESRHAPLRRIEARMSFHVTSDCGLSNEDFWGRYEVQVDHDDDDELGKGHGS